MNKKLEISFLIILFTLSMGLGPVNAQEETIESALSSFGHEGPKVSISGNEVIIKYKQKVSEFGPTFDAALKKIARILDIAYDELSVAYSVKIQIYFDDGHIMEVAGKQEDAAAFLNDQLSTVTYQERLEFNPITRGPPITPGICEPDKGENCENKEECVCYRNESCEINSPRADKKGCVVKQIPPNTHLVGTEYVCDDRYVWNLEMTGCVPIPQDEDITSPPDPSAQPGTLIPAEEKGKVDEREKHKYPDQKVWQSLGGSDSAIPSRQPTDQSLDDSGRLVKPARPSQKGGWETIEPERKDFEPDSPKRRDSLGF